MKVRRVDTRGFAPPVEGSTISRKQDDGPKGIWNVTIPLAVVTARVYSAEPRLVHLARTIAHACPDDNRPCVIAKIHEYVDKRIRYQDDPTGATFVKEFMYTPLRMAQIIAEAGWVRGDCEEIACLTSTLMMAGGVPTGFMVGLQHGPDGDLYHVWVLAQADFAGKRWFHSDPTHHIPLGKIAGRFVDMWFVPI